MPKNSGKGTITQVEKDKPRSKCRKWRLTVCLGKDPYTGKYIQKGKRFTGSYSEAKEALEELKAEMEGADPVMTGDWTYDGYVDHFEDWRALSGEVSAGTLERERTKLDALGFVIGGLKLSDITETVIERAFMDMRQGKSRSGKPLSGTYLNDIYKKASLMFEHAHHRGVISKNPFNRIDAPKIDTAEKEVASKEEIQKLIAAMDPKNHMECALILCATMALRRGEAIALRWEDVDFERNEIHISNSIDNHLEYQSPKTKAGDRILPMPQITATSLKIRYQEEQSQFEKFAPQLLTKDDEGKITGISPKAPVFCEQFGKPLIPNSFGRWWNRNREKYGLPNVTLHGLRHTFLTLAASEGVHPSVMQKLAGHSTSRLTLEIYTHAQMDQKRSAMAAMGDVFEAKPTAPAPAKESDQKTA